MPKNQFQRPLQVNRNRNVPRHGQPQAPLAKAMPRKLMQPAPEALPPLAVLLDQNQRK